MKIKDFKSHLLREWVYEYDCTWVQMHMDMIAHEYDCSYVSIYTHTHTHTYAHSHVAQDRRGYFNEYEY